MTVNCHNTTTFHLAGRLPSMTHCHALLRCCALTGAGWKMYHHWYKAMLYRRGPEQRPWLLLRLVQLFYIVMYLMKAYNVIHFWNFPLDWFGTWLWPNWQYTGTAANLVLDSSARMVRLLLVTFTFLRILYCVTFALSHFIPTSRSGALRRNGSTDVCTVQ